MKQRRTLALLTAACMAAFTFISCSKSDKKDDEPGGPKEEAGKIPGLGTAAGTPQGTALVLPAGITFSGEPIKGAVCDTAYEVGSGGLVEVCVAFVNNNTTDVTFTLPAGLIVISDNAEYQHGFLIQTATVLLKAKKTTRVGANFYCVNSSRLPSARTVTYKVGPVSNSTLLRELCELLKNKRTARKEYADFDQYLMAANSIQMMIWSITDGEGLDRSTLNETLGRIPNR